MKRFTNVNPKDLRQALTTLEQAHSRGEQSMIVGGGSDALQLMRERIINPDVLVNLKAIRTHKAISADRDGLRIGALTTLTNVANDAAVRGRYTALTEAAEAVATPQIRNVGTIGGNVCQRPWCWYYRNGFKCYKNGGSTCFSAGGENELHAIFGGGPSYIVHPSDTAPALVALDAQFQLVSAAGERVVPAGEFFTTPASDPSRENVLRDGEILAEIRLPRAASGRRSTYYKVMDRETWTHAVVSVAIVLDMQRDVCRDARIVLGGVAPIPWRLRGVERMLAGQRVTSELADAVGRAAVVGARPLSKNRYKVPLTEAAVRRTLLDLAARS